MGRHSSIKFLEIVLFNYKGSLLDKLLADWVSRLKPAEKSQMSHQLKTGDSDAKPSVTGTYSKPYTSTFWTFKNMNIPYLMLSFFSTLGVSRPSSSSWLCFTQLCHLGQSHPLDDTSVSMFANWEVWLRFPLSSSHCRVVFLNGISEL